MIFGSTVAPHDLLSFLIASLLYSTNHYVHQSLLQVITKYEDVCCINFDCGRALVTAFHSVILIIRLVTEATSNPEFINLMHVMYQDQCFIKLGCNLKGSYRLLQQATGDFIQSRNLNVKLRFLCIHRMRIYSFRILDNVRSLQKWSKQRQNFFIQLTGNIIITY